MYFRHCSKPHPHLEIVSVQRNPNAEVLRMCVMPSTISAFSLDRGSSAEFLHLKEWSKTETRDVKGNFLGKAVTMDVPLLKSAIHKDVASAACSSSEECFSDWSVSSSGVGNVCHTPG